MNAEIYFFFEWLILQKNMDAEKHDKLSKKEKSELINEYMLFLKKINNKEI